MVEKAEKLAYSGDIESAVTHLQQAAALDADLKLDPGTEARRFAAQGLVEKAEKLAYSGDIESAVTHLQQAAALDANLKLDPEAEARRFAAQGLVEKAKELAYSGDIEGVVTHIQQAYELAPAYDPNEATGVLISAGKSLARQRKTEAAIAAFSRAQKLTPTLKISAESWNSLCWFGSLAGFASDGQIVNACERAVNSGPDDLAQVRDSRGLNRALREDKEGAIEDFQYYVEQGRDKRNRPEERLLQRLQWIDALKIGQNPFDDQTLESLWNQ